MNKSAFRRDWSFYLANHDKFTFCGCVVPELVGDPTGVSAMEAFYALDTLGKTVPCREPELLRAVWICKKSVNFHILLWADGYDDMMCGIPELLQTFSGPVPDWVRLALAKQIRKRRKTDIPLPVTLCTMTRKTLLDAE